MNKQQLNQLLQEKIPNAHITVTSDDDVHFDAIIVSTEFEGLRQLQRQQRVYAVIGDLMNDGTVHAFSMKTFTPEEWQERESV